MNKTIVVTGASGGIGEKLARELLDTADDHDFYFVYGSKVPTFADTLFDGNRCLPFCDMHHLASKDIWGLVNLAGATSNGMTWKTSHEQVDDIMAANLGTTIEACRLLVPGMRERARGRIINISSVTAATGVVGAAHYAAAKGAIEAYTRSLALELAPRFITANTLRLGYFDAGMIETVPPALRDSVEERTPAHRLGNAEDLAHAIWFLLHERSSFVTGQTINLNGGLYL